MSRWSAVVAASFVTSALLCAAAPTSVLAAADTPRKVFVTVVDAQGQAVRDLTPADFTVREDGKDRVIASAAPATTKMRLVLAIEDALASSAGVKQGVFEIAQKLAPHAEISFVIVGLSNRTVVPFTSDVGAIVAALNALPQAARGQMANVLEGVMDLSRGFTKEQAARPVVVLFAIDVPQESSAQPQNVLNTLRDSNAQLHTISLSSGTVAAGSASETMESSARAQILGDGPKQSGGRMWAVGIPTGVPKAAQQVANELLSQYEITYTLPDGVKPSDRINVATKRRGVTLRAPSRISAK